MVFSLNSAKSYLGKNVNLHLISGDVIINVRLIRISEGKIGVGKVATYVSQSVRGKESGEIPLRHIDWAETLDPTIFS